MKQRNSDFLVSVGPALMEFSSNISFKNVTFITCVKKCAFSGVAKLSLSTVYKDDHIYKGDQIVISSYKTFFFRNKKIDQQDFCNRFVVF